MAQRYWHVCLTWRELAHIQHYPLVICDLAGKRGLSLSNIILLAGNEKAGQCYLSTTTSRGWSLKCFINSFMIRMVLVYFGCFDDYVIYRSGSHNI